MTTRRGQVFSTGLAKPPNTAGMPQDGKTQRQGMEWSQAQKKLLSGPCYVVLCILSVAPKSSEICISISYISLSWLNYLRYSMIQWLSSNIELIIVCLSNPCHPSRMAFFHGSPQWHLQQRGLKTSAHVGKRDFEDHSKSSRVKTCSMPWVFCEEKSSEQTIDFAMLQRVHSGIIILNDEPCSWFSGKTRSYIHSSKSYKTPRRLWRLWPQWTKTYRTG